MSIEVRCECGKLIKAPEEAAGRRARCPSCQAIFTVSAAMVAEEFGY